MSASPNPFVVDDRSASSALPAQRVIEFPPAMTAFTVVARYSSAATVELASIGPDGTVYTLFNADIAVTANTTSRTTITAHPGTPLRVRVTPAAAATGYCVITAQGYAGGLQ